MVKQGWSLVNNRDNYINGNNKYVRWNLVAQWKKL